MSKSQTSTSQTKVTVNLPKAGSPINPGDYSATISGGTIKLSPGDITTNIPEGVSPNVKDGTYPVTVREDTNNPENYICELNTPVEVIGTDSASS